MARQFRNLRNKRDDLRIRAVDTKFPKFVQLVVLSMPLFHVTQNQSVFTLKNLKCALSFLKICPISRCPIRHTMDVFVLKQNMLIFVLSHVLKTVIALFFTKILNAESNWPVSLRTRITKLSPTYENEADMLF